MRQQVLLFGCLLPLVAVAACHSPVPTVPQETASGVAVQGKGAVSVASQAPVITMVSAASAEGIQVVGTEDGPAIAGAPPVPDGEASEALDLDTFSRTTRNMAGDVESASILDPWRPNFVGVINRTATSVTLAWNTTAKTRGAVYFGRSLFLRWAGYNQARYVGKSQSNHQVTIEGLSRFTGYTFAVVGLDPILQTQYPAPPIRTRTHLF